MECSNVVKENQMKTLEVQAIEAAILKLGIKNIVEKPLECAAYLRLFALMPADGLSFEDVLKELKPLDYIRPRIERIEEWSSFASGNLKWNESATVKQSVSDKKHLTTNEFALQTGLKPCTIRERCKSGDIMNFYNSHAGRRGEYEIPISEVDRYIAEGKAKRSYIK